MHTDSSNARDEATSILSYKEVRDFCLKLRISITTEPIGLSILSELQIGPVMVLGYFIFRFKSWDSFKLLLDITLSKTEPRMINGSR